MRKPRSKAANTMVPAPAKGDASRQEFFLARAVETFITHQISCWNCAAEDEQQDGTNAEFAKNLHGLGWRYVVSNLYQTEGPLCPECAAKPEDRLGN
jgi:hypothetical protein